MTNRGVDVEFGQRHRPKPGRSNMTTQARTDILNPDRRQLLSQAAMAAVAASVSSLLPLHSAKAGVSGEVRPFHVSVPEQDLLDLRRRLAATRWPDREIVADQSQGVQLTTVQQLVSYWQNDYDWRKIEARLNALPQFVTRSTASTSISFTSARVTKTRCR